MKKNIISQKRVKYICPCCKEIDTILFCCECLRKQKEKTIKQAREEMKKEIKRKLLSLWGNQKKPVIYWKDVLKQLEKEGK